MIPINEAINSGAWFHCEWNYSSDEELTQFRIKVLSFRKLKLSEVDMPENIKFIDPNGAIWLLEIEVVNLTKEHMSPGLGPDKLILIDQDGFNFNLFTDRYLRFISKFAEKSKMDRFWGVDLVPKIKAIGAIPFQLPDDDEAVYSISVKNGSIREA